MQSSALGLTSPNRSTCSQVKAVGSQCCHRLFQRRCTSFLPASSQQFSPHQTLPLRQHRAMGTILKPRHSSRYLTAFAKHKNSLLQNTYTALYQALVTPPEDRHPLVAAMSVGRSGNQQECVESLAYTNTRWDERPACATRKICTTHSFLYNACVTATAQPSSAFIAAAYLEATCCVCFFVPKVACCFMPSGASKH